MRVSKNASIAERLAKYTRNEGACLIWTGKRLPRGYGTLRVNGIMKYAHRLAWEEANGPISAGMFVCHRCDNPSCCNPEHLFLGTHADNMADQQAKKRHGYGERNGNAKLTEPQALEVLVATESRRDLAGRFEVSESTIGHIQRGYSWRHLELAR